MTQKLTNYIGARVEPRVRTAFIKKAKQFGGPSTVLQELVSGFVEDRVTIAPPTPSGIFALPVTETKEGI